MDRSAPRRRGRRAPPRPRARARARPQPRPAKVRAHRSPLRRRPARARLGAVWGLAVSPERKKAAELSSKVDAASAELASAQGKLADARRAQASYASAYASIVKLGKAVPAQDEVPALMYQLAQAS